MDDQNPPESRLSKFWPKQDELRRAGHFELRGIPGLLALFAVEIIFFFAQAQSLLGGGAAERRDENFYLDNHGKLTQVPERTWLIMRVLEPAFIVAFITLCICLVISSMAHRRKWNWYQKSKHSYNLAFTVVFVLQFALLFLCEFLKPIG